MTANGGVLQIWTGYYLKIGRYVPIDQLLKREVFFQQCDHIVYPIMGAFTEWLISTYGIESYLRMYQQQDMTQAYGQTPEQLNGAFVDYVALFGIDPILEQRMEALLVECENSLECDQPQEETIC